MRSPHARTRLAALAATIALTLVAALPGTTAAASFPLRLEAGPQTGYRFDAAGTVVATTSRTFTTPQNATASTRRWFAGRGHHLLVAAGPLAGYWVRESRIAYLDGFTGVGTYLPATGVTLPAGRYEAYKFDTSGEMTAAKSGRYSRSVVVHADRRAVIDGRPYIRIVDGSFASWWIPGSVGAPRAITCVSGPKPAPGAPRIIRSVPAATGRIALTFDMGGRLEPALDIVRFLLLERVCTTVFPTADAALTTQGRAAMALIRAHPELFELGNHTRHHCNLRDGGGGSSACPASRPSDAYVAEELQTADATFASLTGMRSAPYWRPPYGAIDSRLVAAAGAAGYPQAILWTVDTIDWRPVADGGPTASAMIAKVATGATAGGIVLMHLGGWTTRDALPGMLQALAGAGYRPASVSGLYAAASG